MVHAWVIGVLYVAFAAVPLAIATVPYRHLEEPGGLPLFIGLLGAGGASLFHGILVLTPELPASTAVEFGASLAWLFCLDAALLGAAFYGAAEYTGRTWLERPLIVGAIVLVGSMLNLGIVAFPPGSELEMVANAADEVFSIGFSFAALAMFGHQALRSRGKYRAQSLTMLTGFGIATATGIVELNVDAYPVSVVTVGVTVGSGIIAWALFRYDVLQTMPVARETMLDHSPDPILAFDGSGYLLGINGSARETFGFTDATIGEHVESVFTDNPAVAGEYTQGLDDGTLGGVITDGRAHFDTDHPVVAAILAGENPDARDAEADLGMVIDGETEVYHVTTSAFEVSPRQTGQVVVFREITAEKRRAEDLDLLKQVLTRVLRHNIRNDMTVIKGYADVLAAETEGTNAEAATNIVDTASGLAETSEKARMIEDVIDADGQIPHEVGAVVESVVETVSAAHPEGVYETAVPDGIEVRANPHLQRGLEALVENGVVHSDADQPRVRISARRDGPWVAVAVSDNGPGIPSNEVSAIDAGEETALAHSSGAGLWLANTIVSRSGGELHIEATERGTTATVKLQPSEQ
jgi:signal transduction histidine kinase